MNKHNLKTTFISAITAITVIAFIGCTSRNDPKTVVKDFIHENLVDNDISETDFSRPDTTFHITDSAITVMRKNAGALKTYKKNPKYMNVVQGKKLIFITLKYTLQNGEKQSQTFYVNVDGSGVVAFKNNYVK